jgi:hypothetical protein
MENDSIMTSITISLDLVAALSSRALSVGSTLNDYVARVLREHLSASTPERLPLEQDIADIFAHWQRVCRKPRAALDATRKLLIRRALRTYDVDVLRRAIDGCARSDWHSGANPDGKVHNSLELILRDSDHIERFAEMGERATSRIPK